jgi:dTDP-4-amino-4,6-dideoxygalactose transaminase
LGGSPPPVEFWRSGLCTGERCSYCRRRVEASKRFPCEEGLEPAPEGPLTPPASHPVVSAPRQQSDLPGAHDPGARDGLFNEPLHVGRPNLGDKERFLERVNDILERRWLSNFGPYHQEFEQRIAELCEVKHCVAVCNATAGLQLLIRATGMREEVIVPSFTFVATAHALQWLGITPLFCDVDPDTHNLDPDCVEELITPQTTGIVGVHVWGRPCDTDALETIAREYGVTLIFDAAHAIGCSHRERMIGNFGLAEVLSFHATKVLNTFEGGAILTNDDRLAEKLRPMAGFGFTTYDTVVCLGTNAKLNEISAAMGITMLESFDDIVAVNRGNYHQYRSELDDVPGLTVVPYDERERCNYQYVVLELDEAKTGVSRDELMGLLWDENVRARRYFSPGCHLMEPYGSLYPEARLRLRETERLAERVLVLPTGTAVTPSQIAAVSAVIRNVIRRRRPRRRGRRRPPAAVEAG